MIRQFFDLRYTLVFFILFSQFSYGQLQDFSLSVSSTDETCENNGTLNFSTSGTTSGATIVYSIYLLPNVNTAIGITSAETYNGLSAGTYRIIATQSIGIDSNSQQQDVVIADHMAQLSYSLAGASHLCDNKITVNVSQGVAISYEIISGPVLKPLQTSNVFMGLTPGTYLIRVFDGCGDAITQTFTLVDSAGEGLAITLVSTVTNADCNVASITQTLNNGSSENFIYPITIHYAVTPPTGPQIILDQILESGEDDLITISQEIPLFPGQFFTFSLIVTDGCGELYETTGSMAFPVSDPSLSSEAVGCNSMKYAIKNAAGATVTAAPTSYPHPIPHTLANTDENTFLLGILPNGTYTFSIIDFCGVEHIKELIVEAPDVPVPSRTVLNGCVPGFGSVSIVTISDFANVTMVQAPSSAGFSLPYDVSFNIDPQSFNFWMNSLPEGSYLFKTVDVCGNEHNIACLVGTYSLTTTVDIIENCGSFDIQLVPSQSLPNPMSYWLQKFDPVSNTWRHPVTGNVYLDNTAPTTLNSLSLSINLMNYNITGYGHFRVLGRYNIFGNGSSNQNCIVVVEEFDFIAKPKINNVVSVSCGNGIYDVIVDVSGVAPFEYKIITKNGSPFLLDNFTSELFLGVEAAVYGFEVEDDCGNILKADYEIGNSNGFPIEVENLCSGQDVSLSVLSFPYLSYEWWKDGNVSDILGTSNTLNFIDFDPLEDSGTYSVRVFYTDNPASCINFTSQVDVFLSTELPEAGTPSNQSYCGSPGNVDLFTLLSGYDEDGTWQEITDSGMLSGNNWDSSALQPGNYQFKYKVSDSCDNSDEAVLDIEIKAVPDTPTISVDAAICGNLPLRLFASDIHSGIYDWSGPNGFVSNEQNPVIESPTSLNNGQYFLRILLDGCESEMVSTVIAVNEFPEFTIVGGCENAEDNYILRSYPLGGSFQESEVVYSWQGPDGFASSESIISVMNHPIGMYQLTVTNSAGCSSFQDFDVKSTACKIPKGISPNDDGNNDAFDLSGFDVLDLKIYNRYGRLVYEKENYKDQWHGQDFKDRELPDATYFYYILLNNGEERTGWVYKTH